MPDSLAPFISPARVTLARAAHPASPAVSRLRQRRQQDPGQKFSRPRTEFCVQPSQVLEQLGEKSQCRTGSWAAGAGAGRPPGGGCGGRRGKIPPHPALTV